MSRQPTTAWNRTTMGSTSNPPLPQGSRPPRAAKPPPPNYANYSWREHRAPSSQIREFHYITSVEDADHYIPMLRGPIGFDAEWKPTYVRGEPENPIALVQLADNRMVLLIHISQMRWTVPRELRRILEDETVLKLGVGIRGDKTKLRNDLDIIIRGCLELSFMAKAVDYMKWHQRGGDLISLATLTETYVLRILNKANRIRRGNWEPYLQSDFQEYAANDAAAAVSIYDVLKIQMDSIPQSDPIPDPTYFIEASERIIRSFSGYNREFESIPLPPPPDPAVLALKAAKKLEKNKARLEKLQQRGQVNLPEDLVALSTAGDSDSESRSREANSSTATGAMSSAASTSRAPSSKTSLPSAQSPTHTRFFRHQEVHPQSGTLGRDLRDTTRSQTRTKDELPQLSNLRLHSRTTSLNGTPEASTRPLPTILADDRAAATNDGTPPLNTASSGSRLINRVEPELGSSGTSRKRRNRKDSSQGQGQGQGGSYQQRLPSASQQAGAAKSKQQQRKRPRTIGPNDSKGATTRPPPPAMFGRSGAISNGPPP